MSEKLKKLVENRDAILLAEIGALIHDLGKLSEEFVKAHSFEEETSEWIYHTAWLDYEAERGNDDARKSIKILTNTKIKLNSEELSLYDFIVGHHEKKWGNTENYIKPEIYKFSFPDYSGRNLIKFILAADKFDSEEDRAGAKDQQSVYAIFKSNSFGCEEKISVDFKAERRETYRKLIEVLDTCNVDLIIKKRLLLQALSDSFSKTLGMTARAANDVTLWDHSYMTASIMKALLGYYLLCRSIVEENNKGRTCTDKCKKFINEVSTITSDFKKLIREYKPFSVFAIGWDFFGFIEQSHKIPDVVGRTEIIDEIKEETKSIVEEKYALGNSIYEDDFGIYFLIPSVLDEGDLKEVKEEIFSTFNDKTNGILLPVFHLEKPKPNDEFRIGKLQTEAMKKVKEKIGSHQIELITTPVWVEDWKNRDVKLPEDKLVCNVCGKGFYCKGDDEKICKTCKNIRSKGRKKEGSQTVFIDEIAWNSDKKRYENVCLLVAKFDLDEWLSGKFVQSLFIKKPLMVRSLKEVYAGQVKNTLKSDVLRNYLYEKWNEKIEEEIKRNLSYLPEDIRDVFISNLVSELKTQAGNREIKYIMGSINDIVERVFSKYNFSLIEFINMPSVDFQKPPSPARLMRVWRDTTNFFNTIAIKIQEKVPNVKACDIETRGFTLKGKKLTEGLAYIVKIPKLGIYGEIVCEENCDSPTKLRVVTPHLSHYLINNKGNVLGAGIEIYHPERRDLIAVATIGDVISIEGIKACRIVSISPTLFMAIIPAKISFKLVEMIKEEYAKQFGKVFGKLPLHIGLIYFKRKMPIFAVLDAASRMLDEFEKTLNDLVKLRVISEPREKDGCITLILSPETFESATSNEKFIPIKYEIKVPYRLGDGSTDYYHPYLRVSNSDETIEIKAESEILSQKHITKITQGDIIEFERYYFDFEFLDSNTRRFDIGEERRHWLFTNSTNRPKPYLLWDIDNFERLRELIIDKLGLTTTQVMNLYEMLMGKVGEWDLKDVDKLKENTFGKLVESTIKDVPLRLKVVDDGKTEKDKISREDYEFLKESITSGLFFDFVDLWHTILKFKFERGGDENAR